MTTTFDPAHCSTHITLSSGNLHGVQDGTVSDANVNATVYFVLGNVRKLYFEIMRTGAICSSELAFGLANSSESTSNFLGQTNNSCALYSSGNFYRNGSASTGKPTFNSSSTIFQTCVDFLAKLLWLNIDNATGTGTPGSGSGGWNNNNGNPGTGVGGIDISGLNAGSYTAALNLGKIGATPDQGTAQFASGSLSFTPPSGFTTFDASGPTAAQTAPPLFRFKVI